MTRRTPLLRAQLAVKRAVDAAMAVILLVLLLPVMAVIALAVKSTSEGDVIFRQRRAGRNGRWFTIYKFRTMVAGVSERSGAVSADDARITRVGRFLRRTSLDELPQVFNVVKGDMSFVGPRPDLPHHVERYTAFQRRRLAFRPGITGWAQVSGRNYLSWEERIKLDVDYIENWSLARDLVVVGRTAAVVLTGKGVSASRPTRGTVSRNGAEDLA